MVILVLLLACGGDPAKDTGGSDPGETDTIDTADSDVPSDSADSDETGDSADSGDPGDSGEAPPLTDADGDGHDAVEHGGDDCDDAHPHVYPGAPEYCDAIDQDCDGEPLAAGTCGAATPPAAAGRLVLETGHHQAGAVIIRDVTGDGAGEILLLQSDVNDASVYLGGEYPTRPGDGTAETAWHYYSSDGFHVYNWLGDVGDLNGDGVGDLVIAEGELGAAIHFGPIAGPGATSPTVGAADAFWDSYLQGDTWGVEIAGEDLDGDGRTDLVATNSSDPYWGSFPSEIAYNLYFGGEWDLGCTVRVDNGGAASDSCCGDVVGDGDGDGLPEFGLWANGGFYYVSGADTRRLCDAYIDDLAVGFDDEADGFAYPEAALGDWDGDGYDDWVMLQSASEGEVSAWLMSAEVAVSGTVDGDDATGSWLSNAVGGYDRAQGLDVDGDGTRELLLYSRGSLEILRGGDVPALHDQLPERRLTFYDGVTVVCGYYNCEDYDGDGKGDLIAVQGERSPSALYAWVLPGFEIPWDDDAMWVNP